MTAINTVYVEGLPFDWAVERISALFAECGVIDSVRAPQWHDSGRLKGYGFVSFSDADSVSKAIKLNGTMVDTNRWITVQLAGSKPKAVAEGHPGFQSEPSTSLFVKNLPYDCTEDQLGSLFESFGEPASVRLVSEDGRLKGFAYVDFPSIDIVKRIVAKTEKGYEWILGGRHLVLDYASGRARAGFHLRKEAFESRFTKTVKDIKKEVSKPSKYRKRRPTTSSNAVSQHQLL